VFCVLFVFVWFVKAILPRVGFLDSCVPSTVIQNSSLCEIGAG